MGLAAVQEVAVVMKAYDKMTPIIGGAIDKTENKVKTLKSKIASNIGSKLFDFGKVAGGVGLGMGAMLIAPIKAAADMEKMNISLRTSFRGNEEEAKRAFGIINKFAADTPYGMDEVLGSFIKLKNLGLDPSKEALTSYGNTASAMGKSLDQMIEAVADASTGEFERLKEFGIKASSHGNKVSFVFQGVKTTVGKNSKEIEAYLQGIGNKNFAGGMDAQSKSIYGQWSSLTDKMQMSMAKVGDKLIPMLNKLFDSIGPIIDKLADWIDRNPELASTVMKVVAGTAALSLGISALSFTFGGLFKAASGIFSVTEKLGKRFDILSNQKKGLRIVTDDTSGKMSRFSKFMSERAAPAAKKFGEMLKNNAGQALSFVGRNISKGLTTMGQGAGRMFAQMGTATTAMSTKISSASGIMGKAFAGVGKAFSWLGRVFMMNPIIAITVAIGVIVGAVVFMLIKRFGGIREAINGVWTWIKKVGALIFKPILDPIGFVIEQINLVKKIFSSIGEGFMAFLGIGVKKNADAPVTAVAAVTQDMRDYLPASPAKKGALRDINKLKLAETIAETVKPLPPQAMDRMFSSIPKEARGISLRQPVKYDGFKTNNMNVNFIINLMGGTKNDAALVAAECKKQFQVWMKDYYNQQNRVKFT